jgi:hypothetical protein
MLPTYTSTQLYSGSNPCKKTKGTNKEKNIAKLNYEMSALLK